MKVRNAHKRPSLKRLAKTLGVREPELRSIDESRDELLARVIGVLCQKPEAAEGPNGRP